MLKTLLLIISVLGVVSLLIYLITKKYPHKDFSELLARVKLWWGMVFIFILSTFVNPNISIISLAILSFFSLKEFFSMKKTRKNDRRIFIWAYLAIPIQFYWIFTNWYGMFIVFIPIYIFLFLPLARITAGGTKGFVKSVSMTHWGIMLMVFGLSHLAFYGKMNPEYGPNLLLYLVLLTQLTDVVQYMVSKTFGKRKVTPTANPNITIEGLITATIITVLVATLLAPHLTPLTLYFGAISGLLIAVTSFIGTMNISFVKRDLQVDDNGVSVSPKESFLSRIDSLSYTAPLFLHFLRYFFDWI